MHDKDEVLVSGIGRMRREQARDEAVKRFSQTGALIQGPGLPIGFVELSNAYFAASIGAPWKAYEIDTGQIPLFTD